MSIIFRGNGGMTVTVEAADMETFRYMLIGPLMVVQLALSTFTIGGVANTEVQVKVPGTKTLARTIQRPFCQTPPGLGTEISIMYAVGGETWFRFTRPGGIVWTLGANTAWINGQILCEFA